MVSPGNPRRRTKSGARSGSGGNWPIFVDQDTGACLRSEAHQPSAPCVGVTPLLVGCPAASASSSGEWDEGAVEVVEASFPADGEVLELVEWGRGLLHDGADLARPMVSGAERRFMGRSAL